MTIKALLITILILAACSITLVYGYWTGHKDGFREGFDAGFKFTVNQVKKSFLSKFDDGK